MVVPELLDVFRQALEALDRVIGLLAEALQGLLQIALVAAIGVILTALNFVSVGRDVDVAPSTNSFW